jgi:hypothetical protein
MGHGSDVDKLIALGIHVKVTKISTYQCLAHAWPYRGGPKSRITLIPLIVPNPTTSSVHLMTSPPYLMTSLPHLTTSPTHLTTSPTHLTTSPAYLTTSPTYLMTSPAYLMTSPAYLMTSPMHLMTSPACKVLCVNGLKLIKLLG